jgi:hypothetical protein
VAAVFVHWPLLFLIGMGHLPLRRRMRKYNAGTTYQGHNLQSNNPIANDFVHVRDFTLDGHLSKGTEREPGPFNGPSPEAA